VNLEAARKAECVQHVAIMRERFNGAAVFALIEKETGLLPPHDIGLKPQSVLKKSSTGVLPVSEQPLPVGQVEPAPCCVLNVPAETQHQSAASVVLAETTHRFSVRCRRCSRSFLPARTVLRISTASTLRSRATAEDVEGGCRQRAVNQTNNLLQSWEPGRRVQFQDERRVVAVENQARPAVTFTINPPITSRLFVEQAVATCDGLSQS